MKWDLLAKNEIGCITESPLQDTQDFWLGNDPSDEGMRQVKLHTNQSCDKAAKTVKSISIAKWKAATALSLCL
jgi:hypothetical protein